MIKDIKNGKDYKIVICTPAGREKYLSIFKKYIYRKMDEGLVDGWQLWQNTVDQQDITYLESMEKENPKVVRKFVEGITARYNNCDTLLTYKFFKNTHDDDTIYIRFDDDIVWCEEDFILKVAQARIDNPDAFVIYPNIINSTVCTNWHKEKGLYGPEADKVRKLSDNTTDPNWIYLDDFNYTDSKLIDHMHETFKKHYEAGTVSEYYLPQRSFDNYQRFSICSICWWGKDHVEPTKLEESQMAYELAEKLKRPIFFVGDALCLHYSYHTQRDYLESCKPEKLEFYKLITK